MALTWWGAIAARGRLTEAKPKERRGSRRRLLFSPRGKQKPKPKPNPKPSRRPDGRIALFHKADRSRNNKTGQLDLLPTVKSGTSHVIRASDQCDGTRL